MASAQTGTGKTAAFVLPILERLTANRPRAGRGPRVLVLAPTRELAAQVTDDVRKLSRFCPLKFGTIVGGVAYPPQHRLLAQSLDLLVATPGRLLDHMQSGRVDYSRLEVLVLDEADRMLDLGFVDAVKTIAAATPSARQTLLFSATLEGKVLRIANELLNRPERIQLAAVQDRHALIQQRIHSADDADHKRRLLDHHLQCDSLTQALIFTATKRRADRLAKALVKVGHRSAALHGDMRQGRRQRTLESLRRGSVKLLVATDVAARGLDIKGMSHVINFDMPDTADAYIHRIGRTGRAKRNGEAFTLTTPDDRDLVRKIEKIMGQKLPTKTLPDYDYKVPKPDYPQNNNRKPKPRPNGNKRSHARSRQRVRTR